MMELTELIERVEAMSGADREVDCRLSHYFDRGGIWYGTGDDAGFAPPATIDGWTDDQWNKVGKDYVPELTPRYTSSTDTALEFAERVLPGWFVEHIGAEGEGPVGKFATTGWFVMLSDGIADSKASAPTLPLAIIIATLRAKAEELK